MKLIGTQALRNFKIKHADAQAQLDSWEAEVGEAQWNTPHDLKARYPKASLIGGAHVVFNICNNKYRLWVQVSYKNKVILVKNIGSHKEYDNWDIG